MKRGFTLIELVIALSIMLILAALVTGGMRSMMENQREAQTRQAIASTNAIISERLRTIGANIYPAAWYHNGVYGMHNTAGPGLWTRPYWKWDAVQSRYVIQPTTVVDTAIPDDPALWSSSDLLRNTVIVFNDLDRSANGKKALSAMRTVTMTVLIDSAPMTARIPVDGWGRPLLFSPAVGVTADGSTVYQQSTTVANDAALGVNGGTYPYAFSAGKDGNPSDLVSIIR
jgi:prepilin-type N-terminal cleavage/methylation domain-containing protein